MNPLYKLPIHGISCVPFCDFTSHSTLHQINLSFMPLQQSLFNHDVENSHWVMTDQGARYKTEVSLFINNSSACNETHESNHKEYILQINCQGKGQFHIDKNNIKVYWEPKGTDSAHYFQTIGLALWLELNKILCIHANALSYKSNAIALVAPSRTGKTTLTTELCKSEFELMTDDMMAIHSVDNNYTVYPSWPEARMWPESLALLKNSTNNSKDLATSKVHAQFEKRTVSLNEKSGIKFCKTAKPLKTIYFLNRVNSQEEFNQLNNQTEVNANSSNVCNITTIPASQAVILLIQNSILGDAYSALGIESDRFKFLVKLLKKVKFKKISYVSGLSNLRKVEQELIKDLNFN